MKRTPPVESKAHATYRAMANAYFSASKAPTIDEELQALMELSRVVKERLEQIQASGAAVTPESGVVVEESVRVHQLPPRDRGDEQRDARHHAWPEPDVDYSEISDGERALTGETVDVITAVMCRSCKVRGSIPQALQGKELKQLRSEVFCGCDAPDYVKVDP